jgi:hypothetical protein
MSMPSYWYDPMVHNMYTPDPGTGLNANLAQNQVMNQANSRAVTQQSANIEAQAQAAMNWSRGINDNAKKITDAAIASNLAIGNRQPVGTYNGNALSPFATGTAPIQHLGGTNGLQPFNEGSYLVSNPDVFKAGADPWQHYNQFGQNEGRTGAWGNTTFDTSNYLANNPDVFKAGADPMQHWLLSGYDEGRQGGFSGPDFNEQNYLANNPDVFKAGSDPVQHWLQYGQNEGRTGGWGENLFNPQEYLLNNRDVAASGMDPTAHWLQFGSQEGRQQAFGGTEDADWSGYFSQAGTGSRDAIAAAYLANNKDVFDAAQASGRDPTAFGLEHIMAYGADEDRTFFDPVKYGQENPDVLAAGMDPTAHWFQFGQKEGRTAPQSSVFNKETYNLLNPDVAKAGVDPLQHWLTYGQQENRMGGAFESGLMYDQFNGSTYREPWIASIPEARRTAETVNAIKALSQKYGWDPAAYASVVQMETKDSPQELWNPTAHNKLGYWGLSQMGEDSFTDQKDGRLGGMTWQQYQRATPAQQVAMYSAWLDKYAKPENAAGLVRGGIGTLPPEMQAAIMMGTQFGPNKTEWVRALGEGNMNVPTSTKQAPELAPWTIEAMRDAMAAQMAKWPQQQSPWPLQ